MDRVLIVEDIPETRHWLAEIVHAAFPGCAVHGVSSVREGLEAARGDSFDLALIDLGLPDGSGIEILRHLSPSMTCVVTTAMRDDSDVVAALSAGAQGYLLKEQSQEALVRQLIQLQDGVPALSPSIARRIMEHFRFTGPVSGCDGMLTEREKEILSLIARGFRNDDVADTLGIAGSTVSSHIKSIYRKLGISTRAEASWHAVRMGL